ncbi:protein max-like [Clytia hemisphaerica]|uniref:Protein max n=1 Tax=Clytia hemisphaerica TaxID=252671 RepID=A0A7M5X440_9CNID|eukprot:TCONS_00071772-protein
MKKRFLKTCSRYVWSKMMSDEEKIDISGEEDEDGSGPQTFATLAEKRAHHNALERKRRDHIKESFSGLRDSIPSLEGEKSSRAQILHKATEHIQYMRRKNHAHQTDIDELKRHNMILDQQVRELENSRATGTVTIDATAAALLGSASELLLNTSDDKSMNSSSETVVKTEPVLIERPNNAGDHDDYTIAPKKAKVEPE